MKILMKAMGILLFLIHIGLLIWAIGGYMEMIFSNVFWKPFTNPDFPDWLLVFHWGSVLLASTGFINGYLSRWKYTPYAMAIGYGIMALVCLVETFGFMTSSSKYIDMAAEYLTYILILLLLFRSRYFIGYFERKKS